MYDVKVGDVVMLKSGGGPKMTVSHLAVFMEEHHDEFWRPCITCVWYEGNTLRTEYFLPRTLRVCNENE